MSAVSPQVAVASAEAALQPLINHFESLGPAEVDHLAQLYAEDAHFADPFNDVLGRAAIARIFAHMFEQLDDPRFTVTGRFVNGNEAMLRWDFHFRFKRDRVSQRLRGCSHLVFDAQGRVREHIDYWDAAGELYARLPVIGGLMRWLRRRLATPQRLE